MTAHLNIGIKSYLVIESQYDSLDFLSDKQDTNPEKTLLETGPGTDPVSATVVRTHVSGMERWDG